MPFLCLRTVHDFDRASDAIGRLFEHVTFGFVDWHGQKLHCQSKITREFFFHQVRQFLVVELFVSLGKFPAFHRILRRQRINDVLGVGPPALGRLVNKLVYNEIKMQLEVYT